MNVKYTVITYDKVSDTFSISEDDDDTSEDNNNKEDEEVKELCHDLFKDFAPTRENKSAEKSNEKSNEIPTGATSTEGQEALQELASYVVLCGGTRDLLEGWSATRQPSGGWYYISKKGQCFTSRPEVARWLELPGAPMLEQRTSKNIASAEECEEALEKLASYVVLCGGKRDLLEGWSVERYPSGKWYYFSKKGNWFKCRPDVARWLNLPGAPAVQSVRRLSQVFKKRKR